MFLAVRHAGMLVPSLGRPSAQRAEFVKGHPLTLHWSEVYVLVDEPGSPLCQLDLPIMLHIPHATTSAV